MLTKKQIKAALGRTDGNVSAAARALGCTRQNIVAHISRHPDIAQVVLDARSAMVDIAETALHACLLQKEAWAVCFTLKTLGKERGYVERSEVTGRDGRDITIRVVYERDSFDSEETTPVAGNGHKAGVAI